MLELSLLISSSVSTDTQQRGSYAELLLLEAFVLCIFTDLYPIVVLQVCNVVIGLLFLSVVEKVGVSLVYLGFGAVCLLGTLYVSKNVVETKGRTLEEIEREVSPVLYDDAPGFL